MSGYLMSVTETQSPAADSSKTQLVECPKCDGRGRIQAFSHVVGGRCFECEGAGKIEIARISETEAFKIMVGNLYYTASIALRGALRGNMKYAHFYLGQMLDNMFKCGTDNAREVLDFIGEGRFWHSEDNCFRQCDPEVARGLRTRLIELGRERAAA